MSHRDGEIVAPQAGPAGASRPEPPGGGEDRPAVELVGLTKTYRGRAAVDGLTLSIPEGSTFGLIGPNGAGKSTTLRMLMGLLPSTSGSARVLGVDVAARPSRVRQRVGYVPEEHHIYRWMRVREVIGFARALYETWSDEASAGLLELFELEPAKRVKHLSKGMLTKLALLLALAHEPEVLVLDEPTSGLDPLARDEFLDGALRALRGRRCTVLLSSHALEDVERLADSVGILFEGRLLVHGRVDALLAATKRIDAVLRDGGPPRWVPDGVVWQRVDRGTWSLTVRGWTPEALARLRAENPVDDVRVADLGLEALFKDYIRGRRPAR